MSECIAVNCVVDAVKQYAVKEAEKLAEVGDRIMVLNDRLEWLQTFVRDADKKRRSKESEFVAVWIRQTRDVAFQVEDVLDDYRRKKFLAEMERSRWNACFKCLTHPFTQLFILNDLAKRMDKIEKRLTEISKNKDDYNIQSLGEPSSVWTSSSTTNLASWDNLEEHMIGFEGYKKTLMEQLIGPSTDSRAIISIVGDSGTGKTKLAREIFDCEEVQKHFKIRSWTLLPPKYRVTEILAKIHKKVSGQVPCKKNVQEGKDISDILMDELNNNRYLVVLDNMASIVDWNIIKAALPDDTNGSRVLIIMQSGCEGVENFVGPSIRPLKINPLDEQLSKGLFLKRVFGIPDNYPRWIEDSTYGKDVFTLTQGYPLGIVILAGLLRSKESQAEWDSVFKQLKDGKGVKALGRILAMSFDDLPHSLKSCFLYLGALQETKLHEGHKLGRLWIAEGFINPKKGRTLEEIAQQHLKELVSRCLVQLVNKDAQGDVGSISVHNSVHAFVQAEAQEANFFEIHDSVDIIAPSTVRRLSVQNHTDKYVPLSNSFPKLRSLICEFAEKHDNPTKSAPETYQKQHKLRFFHGSIFFHGKHDNTKESAPETYQKQHTLRFLHASKFLRVIDLQGLLLTSLPNEVGGMVHLRYLGVKNCGLNQLPASICNLIYLQTFDVQDTDASNVGEAFWDIPTLRHILAKNIKPPKTMKTKDSLQTLHGIDCASWDDTTLLEKANNLRSLELRLLAPPDLLKQPPDSLEQPLDSLELPPDSLEQPPEALLVALGKLELLAHLKLECSPTIKKKKLECSQKPTIPLHIFNISILRRLHSLEIDGGLEKAQDLDSMHILPNLTKLILKHSGICQGFVDMLAQFPRLSLLKLDYSSYHGESLVFPKNGFQVLTELHLSSDKLVEWRIENNWVMPKLVKLHFWFCTKMKMIPDGMKGWPELKEVMVYQSPMIAKIINEHGDDYPKAQHVPIIRVRWHKKK